MDFPSGRRAAISLAELVLAVLVLAIAYLPLTQMFSLTSHQVIQSRNHLTAHQLASNLFEVYRGRGEDVMQALSGTGVLSTPDILANATAHTGLTGDVPDVNDVLTAGSFKMKVEIEKDVEQKLGLDRVETTVEWQENGRPRSATYARLIAR